MLNIKNSLLHLIFYLLQAKQVMLHYKNFLLHFIFYLLQVKQTMLHLIFYLLLMEQNNLSGGRLPFPLLAYGHTQRLNPKT